MTTAVQLIGQLGAAGIRLWLDDDNQLRFKAPKGALTAELKAALIAQKQEVIDFLMESSGQDSDSSITAINRDQAHYPLSFSQQRFWFLDQLQPGNASLNIPARFLLEGNIDIDALENAFKHLVDKHEILRTVFFIENKQARQKNSRPYQARLQYWKST